MPTGGSRGKASALWEAESACRSKAESICLPVGSEDLAVIGRDGVVPGGAGDASADAAHATVHQADDEGRGRRVVGVGVGGVGVDVDLRQGDAADARAVHVGAAAVARLAVIAPDE